MRHRSNRLGWTGSIHALLAAAGTCAATGPASAAVTYRPYIEPGDASSFGATDQVVVAWQTDETAPSPGAYRVDYSSSDGNTGTVYGVGRVVDNYLAADPSLPVPSAATGPRVDYAALLSGLEYDIQYTYRVTGPGLPAGGFQASFRTRPRGSRFSFLVQGDEGFFPSEASSNPPRIADFEARIVHLMNDVSTISLPGQAKLPDANFALNTGDNVYTNGAEGSYRDFWMPVWNNDVDSNDTGAPFIRSKLFYIVVGNHDIGSTGVSANLLGTTPGGVFSGGTGGGDALAYYNNYYFPLNGPAGVDPQLTLNADAAPIANGFFFQYSGTNYTSPAAIEAYRASTAVDTGSGSTRQIDHMSNYSFDSGNAHFLFLDANPHLFNAILDGAAVYASAPDAFPSYPSVLRTWVINDLDASHQPWKVVVFHQPAFSSGLATLRNSQMRAVAKVLEDHGVNMVFNGHEHNYQRTLPLRALSAVAAPASTSGGPAVAVDTTFDGEAQTVPDGVLYLVEGAGGNRDFDGDLGPARGSGLGVDQEDSATGTFAVNSSLTVPQGPGSWLDVNLTEAEMAPLFAGAGSGQKITARFKAKVFSFADVVVNDNSLTLLQITEPLLSTSSATAANPAPFGTDLHGVPLNDPIPDTLIDPTTGNIVSPPATGTPALLDKFTVTKPKLDNRLTVKVSGGPASSGTTASSYQVQVANGSPYSLNGTQIVVTLPAGEQFAGSLSDMTTMHGREVVVTLGRLAAGTSASANFPVQVSGGQNGNQDQGNGPSVVVRSSTAMPVTASSQNQQ